MQSLYISSQSLESAPVKGLEVQLAWISLLFFEIHPDVLLKSIVLPLKKASFMSRFLLEVLASLKLVFEDLELPLSREKEATMKVPGVPSYEARLCRCFVWWSDFLADPMVACYSGRLTPKKIIRSSIEWHIMERMPMPKVSCWASKNRVRGSDYV